MVAFLASCQSSWRQSIPEAEIVYQSLVYPSELGFINANGENNQTIEIKKSLKKPIWSSDGSIIFGLSGGAGVDYGYPAYWEPGKGRFRVCDRNQPFFTHIQGTDNVNNSYEVIVQDGWEITVFDIAQCKRGHTYVDYSDNVGDYSIAGFSYQPTTQELLYGLVINPSTNREYKIIKLDINTGVEVILAEGINPAWSPDGTQIVYLGMDGMYAINADGSEPIRLVNQQFFDPWHNVSPWTMTSLIRWSADGNWLIYHRCETEDICKREDANIYRIRLNNGLEEIIIEGGKFPSWRP